VLESVNAHNHFRGKEAGNNLLKMIPSDEMEAVAQAWADQCKWEHGMLYDCNGDRLGQNLFVEASTGGYPALNMTYVIESWNNERNDFDFATGKCKSGKVCGHWTQVAAARTHEVGCAYAHCPTMTVGGSVWKNALYVVCDYTKPGNMYGEPIFNPGSPCGSCDTEGLGSGYKCTTNLCERCSPSKDDTCKCAKSHVYCENGGSWSSSDCQCFCAKGFHGDTCEHACTCADTSKDCGAWTEFCYNDDYSDFMGEKCKTTCEYACSLPPSCS